ncbi:MAG: hypothetical protein MZV64_21610 [Ignavibacteriales bacterium]|nr:hypothetical protein [Ignavibacteriales bacterium]
MKAFIKISSGVSNASVYWSVDTTLGFTSIPMSQTSADTLAAFIPPQQLNTKIFYYISTAQILERL